MLLFIFLFPLLINSYIKKGAIQPDKISSTQTITIDIKGAVINPGVYSVPSNSNVNDAINAAGGPKDLGTKCINLARALQNEEMILVPTTSECENNELININSANQATLMQLPRIGEVTAQKIIDYRTQNGAFQKIEDIKNVNGIGEATFSNISKLITV